MARKPWATKEWKLQREELLKERVCKWCGSNENLIIHHTHETRNKNYALRRSIVNKIIKDEIDSGKLVPEGGRGRLSKEQFLKLVAKNKEKLDEQCSPHIDYSDIKKLADNGEIAILCNRCHFALHKHMHLCPKCKKNYTRYPYCYSCNEETKVLKEVELSDTLKRKEL